MKRLSRLSIVLAVLVIVSPIWISAQTNPPGTTTTTAIRLSYQSETITIDATGGGVGFTGSKINPTCTGCIPSLSRASAAVCSLETGDIRLSTVAANAPTSSVGIYIIAGQSFTIYGYNDISAFRAIRVTATSGTLNCTYYR